MDNWALITGASAGIGYEFARLLAADKFPLVLVARNEARLQQVARELESAYQIPTKVIPSDLSRKESAAQIFDALKPVNVSVLINNAGFGYRGDFLQTDLQRSIDMLNVNMNAVVQLTWLFAQPMRQRRSGRILNVASTAAFQPGPLTAIYYASKAFVFSFSLALEQEFAGSGVTVTTLCPGATRTEFHERANMQRSTRWLHMMSAAEVARIGYRGLQSGKSIIIPGFMNKLTSVFARRLPVRFTARVVQKINAT